MKKILLALLLSPLCGYSQMNLQHEFLGFGGSVVNFSAHGAKIIETDTGSTTWLKLYTSPNTLWKTIVVPQVSGFTPNGISIISDHLLNSDDLVEYGVTYMGTIPGEYEYRVYNELGTMIFSIPGGFGGSAIKPDENDGWKVFVTMYNNTTPVYFSTREYAVSGELPCISCSGLKVSSTNKQRSYISEPIPNPSSGSFIVNYALPMGENAVMFIYNITGQQVGSYPLPSGKNSIEITDSFTPGSYMYNIRTSSGLSESKKLTIK